MDVSASLQCIDPSIKPQRVYNCHIETLYSRLVTNDNDISYHPMSVDTARRKRKICDIDPKEREVLKFVTQRQNLLFITAPTKRRKIDPKIIIAVKETKIEEFHEYLDSEGFSHECFIQKRFRDKLIILPKAKTEALHKYRELSYKIRHSDARIARFSLELSGESDISAHLYIYKEDIYIFLHYKEDYYVKSNTVYCNSQYQFESG